ncbi:MAG: GNAT family N-acetyltransferase [Ardenticatenaceae bacterium]|nr:GNAT family N-acetyltransferase [Ardenticatenaceae bacterium]
MSVPAHSPTGWVRPVQLRGGLQAVIRPIKPEDAPRLIDLFGRLSRESVYYRFFFKRKELGLDEANHLATVDYHKRMAFVAEVEEGDQLKLIGVARYEPLTAPPDAAEMAIVVSDDYQHHGVGRLLLHTLGDYALTLGYTTFLAEVLSDNYRMIAFCERLGYPLRIKSEGTMRHIWITLRPSKELLAAPHTSGAAHRE